MTGGEDYLLRPVEAGMCSMVDLKSGAVDLFDIAMLNDYLDIKAENKNRIEEWRQKNER
jgi:hypothetical protein